MFTKDSRPIEEALADFFKTQMDLKIEGQYLLDYRTYMELVLEVRRKKRDWERASSLSGGGIDWLRACCRINVGSVVCGPW